MINEKRKGGCDCYPLQINRPAKTPCSVQCMLSIASEIQRTLNVYIFVPFANVHTLFQSDSPRRIRIRILTFHFFLYSPSVNIHIQCLLCTTFKVISRARRDHDSTMNHRLKSYITGQRIRSPEMHLETPRVTDRLLVHGVQGIHYCGQCTYPINAEYTRKSKGNFSSCCVDRYTWGSIMKKANCCRLCYYIQCTPASLIHCSIGLPHPVKQGIFLTRTVSLNLHYFNLQFHRKKARRSPNKDSH